MKAKDWRGLAYAVLATQLPRLLGVALAAEGGGVQNLANALAGYVAGFKDLLLVVSLAMLGSGLALKFLPTGSHRTKDAAGQPIDNALILGALVTLGLYLVASAGWVAQTATGQGEAPSVSSPWELPR
jgi:hypothetical protein